MHDAAEVIANYIMFIAISTRMMTATTITIGDDEDAQWVNGSFGQLQRIADSWINAVTITTAK